MLSKDLALYSCTRGRASPDRLTRKTHAHYVTLVEQLLALYRDGAGCTREDLHRAAEAIFCEEPDCPPQRVRALVRLLDQASEYQTDIDGRAYRLRQQVFEKAARFHPLVVEPDGLFQYAEREVKARIADEIGMAWPRIEAAMYADLPAFHRLIRIKGYASAADLLRRYNVAQAQTLLFFAEEMTVTAREDFKRIFRYAKLNGLLHEIESAGPDAFRIRFTGPASVLSETRRYGVHMGAFLPVLLTCRGWRMSARLRLPLGVARFDLSPEDGLQSYLSAPEQFDSSVEQAFAEKFGAEREGWTLRHEGGFLVRGQRVFVPDFVATHEDGTRVYLEIVGFWTPEYLAAKARTLTLFAEVPILVAIAAKTVHKLPKLSAEVVTYKTRLKVAPVLERLESIRQRKTQGASTD